MAAFNRLKGLFQRSDSRDSKSEPTPEKPGGAGGTVLSPRSPELTALEMAQQQDWEAKQLKVWEPGDVILDTYQVEDVMSGGMGYVYITTHRNWNVKVAIKSPNQMMLSNRAFYARVLREADSWIDLGLHPHIAYCYYVRKVEDIPHIFIEYVDGGNLRDWVSEARCYDLKVGLDLAIQFCHGMEYAQKHGMIAHRDIKPENILMTQDGLLKITDFGIARFQKTEEEQKTSDSADMPDMRNGQLTTYGTRMGSYDYMSPEHYDDVHNVDIRADIYSFGVCLYEMFCGRKPYGTSSQVPASVVAQADSRNPYEPTELRGDMPPQLAQLLKRCCALNREERYGSIKELQDELLQLYRRIFDEDPEHAAVDEIGLLADGLNNQAVSYLELGREEDAEKLLDEALGVERTHPEATYNRGILLWRSGRTADDALLTQLEGISGTRPDDWRPMYLKGLVHIERGDKEGAVAELESVRTASGGVAELESALARARGCGATGHVRTLEGHTGAIYSVSISPDGLYAVSGSYDNTLRLWELDTGRCIRTLVKHTGWAKYVNSASISPDGRYVLGSEGHILRLWELGTGRCIRTLEGHTDSVTSVSTSPDGRYAVSGSRKKNRSTISYGFDDRTLRLWDLGTGRCIRVFEGYTDSVTSVCISPDGRYAVSGSYDRNLRLWESGTGRCIRTFYGHTGGVKAVCISPDGKYALSGSDDKTLRLWELGTGRCIRTFQGHTGLVESVSISPNGEYAVSGSSDNALRLWELDTGRCIRTFQRHTSAVTSVSILPDGRHVLSGSDDKTLRLWELGELELGELRGGPFVMAKPSSSRELRDTASKFRTLLDRAEGLLKSGASKEAGLAIEEARGLPGYQELPDLLRLWRQAGMRGIRSGLHSGRHVRTFQGHTGPVTSVSTSPDGRYAVSGSVGLGNTLCLWELDTGRCIRTFEGHTDTVCSVCISPDGRYAVSGSVGLGNTLRLWELGTGRLIDTLHRMNEHARPVCISPDWRYTLTVDLGRTLCLRGLGKGWDIRNFKGHFDDVNSVSISPDGLYALSGSRDKTLRLWELGTGRCIRTVQRHTSAVTSVSISPDGRYALSGSKDKTLRLWELSTGRCIRTFQGHTGSVTSVSISPDGLYAVSGSWDKTLRLWEIGTGRCMRTFQGHTGSVTSVSISPDGLYALSGSEDSTLRLWELDWEYEFPDPADWDEGAMPYLETFLTLHTPYAYELPDDREPSEEEIEQALIRRGQPGWTEEDFQQLVKQLQYSGYGWLRPEGVRKELEKMASDWQGPPKIMGDS